MRTFKPLAFLALALTLCVLPKLTAEEKLDLPQAKPKAHLIQTPAIQTYPWETGDEAAIRSQLAKRSGEICFDGIACDQALDYFAELTSLNLHVYWSAIEAARVDRDKEITVRVTGVKYAQALDLILIELGGGEVELAYEIRGNLIEVSTKEDLAKSAIVVIYDVKDLMGYSSVHTLYGESTYVCGDIVRLAYIVQTMVDPESWRESGGNTGSIVDYGEMIIVTQTRSAQQQIWDMLNSMREGWKQERL